MGEAIYSFFNLFKLCARWGGWSSPRPGRFIARKETVDWVDSSAGLDGKRRPPPPEFDPRTLQPTARRCSDYKIPARTHFKITH